MYNSWNFAKNFFCKTCRQRTSKMRLNFTWNTFVFGRKNRENAPRTFFFTCKVKTSKMRPKHFCRLWCILTSWQTALIWDAKIRKMRPELLYKPCKRRIPKMRLNFLYAVPWERLQSWKYFEKIFELCVVKFYPVKEITSKNASADFQNFCRLAYKKGAESAVFSAWREHWWAEFHKGSNRSYLRMCLSSRDPTFGEFVPRLGISATFVEKFGELRYLGIF